jgi:hypothetical protein
MAVQAGPKIGDGFKERPSTVIRQAQFRPLSEFLLIHITITYTQLIAWGMRTLFEDAPILHVAVCGN